MKKVNFTQAGGFPTDEKTFDFMQAAYFDVLKTVIGHFGLPETGNFIISGCELGSSVTGTGPHAVITAGIMYIDGDLCIFDEIAGGNFTKIKKIEIIEDAPFESAGNLPTYYSYKAMENSSGVALSEFVRLPKVQELVNQTIHWEDIPDKPAIVIDPAVAPALTIWQRIELLEKKAAVFTAGGGMVLWNKPANQIPWGWHEVVDWRGRMPIGLDNTVDSSGAFVNPEFSPLTTGVVDPGRIGGNKGVTLIADNLPKIELKYGASQNDEGDPGDNIVTSGNEQYNSNKTFFSFGSTTPTKVGILNPYRTVIFIEYTGVA